MRGDSEDIISYAKQTPPVPSDHSNFLMREAKVDQRFVHVVRALQRTRTSPSGGLRPRSCIDYRCLDVL